MPEASGPVIPDKLYFRIGEVSDIVGVKPYVLRYWETEFSDIKPTKSKSGQRLYRRKDVKLLLSIKDLLYSQRFTIDGAKQCLKEGGKPQSAESKAEPVQQIMFEESGSTEETPSVQSVPSGDKPFGDRKFLEKIKSDLEWCLSELRSEV